MQVAFTVLKAIGVHVGLGVFVLISGCAPLTQAEVKALETRELDLPYNEAYQAAMNGLFSLGFTLDHTDMASGVVTGKRQDPQTGAKIGAAIAFGVIGLLAVGDRNEAVTFKLVKLAPRLTQLRMKVIINGKPVTDRTFMTKIWQQIEREAMLESRPSEINPSTQPSDDRSTMQPDSSPET